MLEKHYDPTLGCVDWPALRLEYGQKLASVDDPQAAYALMNQLLGELGQSHFRVYGPGAESDADVRGPARVPIQVRLIDGQVVVVNGALDGHESGVPPGAVITKVDDRELAPLIAATRAGASREGEADALASRKIANALSGPVDAARVITYLAPNGDAAVTRTVLCVEPDAEKLSLGNLRDLPTRVDARVLPGTKIGYLAFNFWMLPMVEKVEQAVAGLRAEGVTAMILDLRGNPGGVGAMVVPIGRLFLRDPASLGTMRFRDFELSFNVAENPDAFTGPLVLLVDEGTASTSEIFAVGMRDLGRVTIVGARPSAGAALPSLIERLDGGALLQYVVSDYTSPKGAAAEGRGIDPDVRVPESRDDYIAGRDPVLAAAIARVHEVEDAQLAPEREGVPKP